MNTPDPTVDTSSLLKCYVLLGIGLPLTFINVAVLSSIALLALIIGIIWAYLLRRRPNPLFQNHGRWMVRTFWISMLFFGVAMIAWMAVFASNADQTAILPMLDAMKSGSAAPTDVQAAMLQFQADNQNLIVLSTVGCFILPIIHATIRLGKGYRAADAGREMPDLKTWWL